MFEGQKITVGVWTGDNEGENGRRRVEAVGPITQDLVGLGNVLSPYCLQWTPLEGGGARMRVQQEQSLAWSVLQEDHSGCWWEWMGRDKPAVTQGRYYCGLDSG